MNTPSKTVKEKIQIMENLLLSFYKINKKYSTYVNKKYLLILAEDQYQLFDNRCDRRVLSLKHKTWDYYPGINDEHIIVNGDYRFTLAFDDKIFINSKLTEKKYDEIIFNHLLLNQVSVPSYEDIELAIGIRNIMKIDKNVRNIGLVLNYKHIDWDMISNIKELYT